MLSQEEARTAAARRLLAEEEAREVEEARTADAHRLLAEEEAREAEEGRVAAAARAEAQRSADARRRADAARQAQALEEDERRKADEARLADSRRQAELEVREAQRRRKATDEAEAQRRQVEVTQWVRPEQAGVARSTPSGALDPAEQARLAQLKADAEALARQSADRRRATLTVLGPVPVEPRSMQDAVGGTNPADRELAARHRQQQDLLKQMNEALKRSVSPAPEAPTPIELNLTRRAEEKTDSSYRLPTAAPPRSAAPRPLVFGRSQPGEEANLWGGAQSASTGQPSVGSVGSFEEALRRVDSSLEALVGQPVAGSADLLVEPIIEAEIAGPADTPSTDLEDPTDSPDDARLRRQRLLRRAMESLGSVSATAPSGSTSPPSGVMPSPSATRSAARAAAPAAARPQASSAGLPTTTPQDLQLAAQIEARHEQLKKKDYFATLGVTPQASREQIKAAFLSLARTFHPDRLPPSLSGLASKMSAVFEGIREAYETLYDDARRTAYQATQAALRARTPVLPAPGLSSATQQQASDLFKMGDAWFKKRDYKQAEDHFARAHALDRGGQTLAAQAWAIYMDPSRKAEAAAARAMMQKALIIDPACDRAHYQLGVIARVEGDMDRAEKHFREAVRINPRHLEASQELRLIEMRRKKEKEQAGKKGGGIFG